MRHSFTRYAYAHARSREWTVYSVGLSGSRQDALSTHGTERAAQREVNRLFSLRDERNRALPDRLPR